MSSRTQALLTAPPLPLPLGLTAPNTFAFAIQAGVNLTEVWIVGQLGTAEALAAMALVFPLLMLTQTMSGGPGGPSLGHCPRARHIQPATRRTACLARHMALYWARPRFYCCSFYSVAISSSSSVAKVLSSRPRWPIAGCCIWAGRFYGLMALSARYFVAPAIWPFRPS